MASRRLRVSVLVVLAGLVAGVVPAGAKPGSGDPDPQPAAAAGLAWEHVQSKSSSPEDTGWNRTSSPTIADVDGDGVNDIVVGHQDGILRVFRADGSLLWARPVVPHAAAPGDPTAIDSTPTVADLDRDGAVEIIVGVGSTWVPNQQGGLVAFDRAGNRRWVFGDAIDFGNVWTESPANDGFREGVFSTPAVGDVDGDGFPDVVFGTWDQRLVALDRNGHYVPGFPVAMDDTVWSSPALHDVDNDGRMEIFTGGDSAAGSSIDINGGVFRGLDWQPGGRVVDMWAPRLIHEVIMSSPSIGDINGDGRLEAVTGTGDFWQRRGEPHVTASRRLWAFDLLTGNDVPGWPVPTDGWVKAQPALGDVDGNGTLDVVAGTNDGWVYAWRGDGNRIWGVRPPSDPLHQPLSVIGGAIIADVDGQVGQEVVVSNVFGTHVLDGRNGGTKQQLVRFWSSETSPALGFFGDRWRLVVSSFDTPNRKSRLAAFDVPAPTRVEWSQWRKNARHLGTGATLTPTQRTIARACPAGGVEAGRFVDVPAGNVHRGAIDCVAWWGVALGRGTSYDPGGLVTRGQMASFIARLIEESGGQLPADPADHFADDDGSPHELNINRLAAVGVVAGVGAGRYAPREVVRRDQMATFLVRAHHARTGQQLHAIGDYFSDDEANAHRDNINRAASAGFTGGRADGTYQPLAFVPRDQMASFLARLLDLLVGGGHARLPA